MTALFSPDGLVPQAKCLAALPALIWLNAVADVLIGAAFALIPVALLWFYRRRADLSLGWTIGVPAAFLAACGLTHLLDAWTLWVPGYWLAGGAKGLAALLAVASVLALVRLLPNALATPTVTNLRAEMRQREQAEGELQRLNEALELRVAARTVELQTAVSQLKLEIDERTKAEQAQRETEEQLRILVEHAPEAIVVLDMARGRFTLVNDNACRLFGMPREELLKHGPIELSAPIQPDGRPPEEAAEGKLEAAMRGETPVFEWLHRDAQGRDILCEVRLVRLPSSNASLIRGSIIDIAERKRIEEAARKSETKFSTVFRTCPEAITIATLDDGVYRDVNDAFERLYGVPREEAIGHSSVDLGVWVNPSERTEMVRQLRECRRVTGFPSLVRQRSGEVRTVEISAEAIDIDGTPSLIAVVRDITDRQRAEREIMRLNGELEQRILLRTAELEVANRELESFSYSVSHDLRAPLRSIHGFGQALLEDCGPSLNDVGRRHLERIQAGAQRMGQLIDDLLQLSRVTRAEMVRQHVDLSAIARDLVQELRTAEPERQVHIKIEDELHSTGDARLLRVALENLISNAWKFTSRRDDGRIEFGLKPGSKQIFRVQDNGAGFDMAFSSKLFGAFQRLHGVKEFPGTGVGLATVHRIIRRHGGRIWAESAVGRGAAFYFSLGEELRPE